jgi:hypothetical protein
VSGELNSVVAVALGKAIDTHDTQGRIDPDPVWAIDTDDTQGRIDPDPVWVLCRRKAPCPLLKIKLSCQAHILVTTPTELLCHQNESVKLKLSTALVIHFILSEENDPV